MEMKSEMNRVQKCMKPNLVRTDSRMGCLKIKVAQNDLKHILVLEFLKSDEIVKIGFFYNCPLPQ